MNYQETLDFLFKSLPMYQRMGKAAYKANLDNTLALDDYLDHPHKKFKSIHIAGTNGKGSVSHMLASVLMKAGYNTGLYTSPHLIDFRERIRINGQMIDEDFVISFVESIQNKILELQPSFFEMTVALAFDYFAMKKVDLAIIETGMGGRLDSTNIITPEVSVITSISIDHTDFLGTSLEQIAFEKAGIIKRNIPCINGNTDEKINSVIKSVAAKNNAMLIYPFHQRKFKYQTETIHNTAVYHFDNTGKGGDEIIYSDLKGFYQRQNLPVALSVLDYLRDYNMAITDSVISEGLQNVIKNTGLRGRWEIIGQNPRVICDTAHNQDGVKIVMEQLLLTPSENLHIVWGMVGDKSPNNM